MKTDALFYELFRLAPRSLFDLVRLDMEGEYVFESITVKTTEKRFDGFFRRTDGTGPNIFLEVQGYDDDRIYWRFFREICTWHEQQESGDDVPFVAVALFLDRKYKPRRCPLRCAPPNRMIRMTLDECLESLGTNPGVLTVLRPFGLSDRERLPQAVSEWKGEIDALDMPGHKKDKLTELLEYVILQCFPKLLLKEVRDMIGLTPLEETAAGQELIQIGKKEGKQESRKEIAMNMLKMGLDAKTVSQATGLSEKEIRQLSLSAKDRR